MEPTPHPGPGKRDRPTPELSALETELSSATWLAGVAAKRLANDATRRRRRRVLTPPPFRYPGVRLDAR